VIRDLYDTTRYCEIRLCYEIRVYARRPYWWRE